MVSAGAILEELVERAADRLRKKGERARELVKAHLVANRGVSCCRGDPDRRRMPDTIGDFAVNRMSDPLS